MGEEDKRRSKGNSKISEHSRCPRPHPLPYGGLGRVEETRFRNYRQSPGRHQPFMSTAESPAKKRNPEVVTFLG